MQERVRAEKREKESGNIEQSGEQEVGREETLEEMEQITEEIGQEKEIEVNMKEVYLFFSSSC